MEIDRLGKYLSVTIAATASQSERVKFDNFAGGMVLFPASWTAASLGFQVSADGTNFLPLYDVQGNLVEVTASAGKAFALPDELYGAMWVKLWSQTAGSGVNQASDRILTLSLKS